MTWIKIDDKLTSHPKWVGLNRHGNQTALEAKSLWFHAAVWCGSHNNDGVIPVEAMPMILLQASIPPAHEKAATDALVRARMWTRRALRKGGGVEINDWLEYQPSRQQVKDRAQAAEVNAELEQLHDWLHKKAVGKKVKAIINARDGAWCRYCGAITNPTPGDRRSPHRRTFDLVDPASRWDTDAKAMPDAEIALLAAMWAVACGWCNAIKGRRTPDEADLVLLPPIATRPRVLPQSAANRSGTVPPVGTVLPGSGQDGPGAGLSGSVAGACGSDGSCASVAGCECPFEAGKRVGHVA